MEGQGATTVVMTEGSQLIARRKGNGSPGVEEGASSVSSGDIPGGKEGAANDGKWWKWGMLAGVRNDFCNWAAVYGSDWTDGLSVNLMVLIN